MVLKKSEYKEKTKLNFDALLMLVEGFVDKRLLRGVKSIPVADIKGFVPYEDREEFLAFFIKKYQEAGWTIKRDTYSDFRESWDTLQFS